MLPDVGVFYIFAATSVSVFSVCEVDSNIFDPVKLPWSAFHSYLHSQVLSCWLNTKMAASKMPQSNFHSYSAQTNGCCHRDDIHFRFDLEM